MITEKRHAPPEDFQLISINRREQYEERKFPQVLCIVCIVMLINHIISFEDLINRKLLIN